MCMHAFHSSAQRASLSSTSEPALQGCVLGFMAPLSLFPHSLLVFFHFLLFPLLHSLVLHCHDFVLSPASSLFLLSLSALLLLSLSSLHHCLSYHCLKKNYMVNLRVVGLRTTVTQPVNYTKRRSRYSGVYAN